MEFLTFTWDQKKDKTNQNKHGVSFEEAKSVFYDERAVEFSDPQHSDDESRFLMVGHSYRFRLLIVCHCYREDDSVIRIISARKLTSNERRTLWGGVIMRKEYDFSTMKGRKNPYLKQLKKQVTLRLGTDVIEYFKGMSAETGIPYQNLINLYLRDCTHTRRKLTINWGTSDRKQAL